MKLLITGGTGFLGRRAAAYFSVSGYHVLTPLRTELDITDQNSVDRWFRQHHPDATIHCAAVSDTGLCQKEPEWSHRINVTGSVHLAQACEHTGATFLFCSSDQVYHASSRPGPHTESEVLHPETVYARQKLQAEECCASACRNTISLRLSWMYSPQFLPGEHGHLLTQIRDLLSGDEVSMVRSVQDFRGITDADSVVWNLPGALNLPAGVYNFGAGNELDAYHTLKTVFEAMGRHDVLGRLRPDEKAPFRDIRMDCSLAASHGIRFGSTADGLYRVLSTFF